MTKLTKSFAQLAAPAMRDRKGTISVLAAMSLTALIGFAGLGTEVSYWYVQQREMQNAADSASSAAVADLLAGDTFASGSPTTAAKAVAAQYGFVDGTNGVTVAVNNPPASGPNSSNDNAVEVIISQPQQRLFSSLFMNSNPTIGGRAVSLSNTSGGASACLIALDTGNVIDINDSGTAQLNMPSCDMYVNSSNAGFALQMSGTAKINANASYVVGGASISGLAQLNDSNGTYLNTGDPTPDPYAGVQIQSHSGCAQSNPNVSGSGHNVTLQPGDYCSGITISGSGNNVTLSSGTYYLDGGSLNVSGTNTITGSNVTIVLTNNGATYATVNISGGSSITLSAPTSGNYAGLAFYQNRNAPATGTDSFSGTSAMNITGAIYFPNQTVNYSGGAATGGAQCTQLVALKVSISGTTNFNSNCSGTGVVAAGNHGGQNGGGGSSTISLVE